MLLLPAQLQNSSSLEVIAYCSLQKSGELRNLKETREQTLGPIWYTLYQLFFYFSVLIKL